MKRLCLPCAIGLSCLNPLMEAATSHVSIDRDTSGHWQLHRDGEPYHINGAGGFAQLTALRDHGGNTVRTWGIEQLGLADDKPHLLDQAHDLGLTVMVGLWITHPRHGADYDDPSFLTNQRNRVRDAVRRLRDHPALLLWGLGNEMEGDGDDPRVWRELEVLARIIKEEDPHHPVCTVLAGTDNHKVAKMMVHYTSLDILGINMYAGAENVPADLAAQGWDRPYLLTEFGPDGHWEVPATPWDAPLEPPTAAKISTYTRAHQAQYAAAPGRPTCLGTFCFLWGHKQETTATWFSMFLPSGEKTPVVDAMSRLWTGQEPANRAPTIDQLTSPLAQAEVAPGSTWTITATTTDPDQDQLSYDWQVIAETTDRKFGGDRENAPPVIPGCIRENHGPQALIEAPATPGPYRVFLFVRDGRGGGASHNFPFLVTGP